MLAGASRKAGARAAHHDHAGKCYTFIAAIAGGAGPQELEIQLVAQSIIPGLVPMMASRRERGQGRPRQGDRVHQARAPPHRVPSKWVIKAIKGSGTVVRTGVLEVSRAHRLRPLFGVALGAILAWSLRRSSPASKVPSSRRGPSPWSRVRRPRLVPAVGYFVAFHGDWSYLYLVPGSTSPARFDLGLVLLAGAASSAVLARGALGAKRFGPLVAMVVTPGALAVIGLTLVARRLAVSARTRSSTGTSARSHRASALARASC